MEEPLRHGYRIKKPLRSPSSPRVRDTVGKCLRLQRRPSLPAEARPTDPICSRFVLSAFRMGPTEQKQMPPFSRMTGTALSQKLEPQSASCFSGFAPKGGERRRRAHAFWNIHRVCIALYLFRFTKYAIEAYKKICRFYFSTAVPSVSWMMALL